MVTLIHGPNIVSSRSYLLKQKQTYEEVIQVDLKDKEKFQLPVSKTLFGKKTLVVLENFESKKKVLLWGLDKIDVILWSSQTLEVPSWVEKDLLFKETDNWSTFKYSDSISYGEETVALRILENLLHSSTPPELIIGALGRQLRNLSLTVFGELNKASSSSFVQNKLREQAKNWTPKKLGSAAKLLLKADWALKNGKLKKEPVLEMLTVRLCQLANS